jgi:hypothetical protein
LNRKPELRQRVEAEIPSDLSMANNENWILEFRRCVLDRAWVELADHQRQSPGNYAFTILRLAAESPDADNATLARQLASRTGREISAMAFRKQLSRGRRLFARLIVREVKQSLRSPSAEDLWNELAELGLMPYLIGYLSED